MQWMGGRGAVRGWWGLGVRLRPVGAQLAALALVALGTLVAAPAASAATEPDLVVSKVYPPHPPGAVVGSGLHAHSKVVNRGDARAPRSKTGFYLSDDRQLDGDDVELDGSNQSLPALPGDQADSGGARAVVPLDVPQGIYYLAACADVTERIKEADEGNNCGMLRGRITITHEMGDPPGGALGTGNPVDEIPAAADRIESAGKCPISAHGQGIIDPSNCVWVTTPRYQNSQLHNLEITRGLFDCPSTNPFPFEVAVGFDPMWENQSGGGFVFVNEMSTSGTKWRLDGNGEVMSYSGHSGEVGGASFKFEIVGRSDAGDEIPHAQARFLCSDRRANSYWP